MSLQRSSSLSTLNLTLERKSSAESPSSVRGGQFIHNGLAVDGQGSLAVTQVSIERSSSKGGGVSKPSTGLSETGRKIKRQPPMPPPAITAPAPSTTSPESGRLSIKAQGKQPMALGQEAEPRANSELASPKYVDVPDTPDTCDRTPIPERTPPNSHYRAYSRSRPIAPTAPPPPPIGTTPASPLENGAQQLFFHGIGEEEVDTPAAASSPTVSPSRVELDEQEEEECTNARQPAQPSLATTAEESAVESPPLAEVAERTGAMREAAMEEVAARVAAARVAAAEAAAEAEATEATMAAATAAAARAAEATAGRRGAAAAGAAARAAQAQAAGLAVGSAMGGAGGAIARKQLSVIYDFVAMEACELSAAAGSKLELLADQRTAGKGWCLVRDAEGRTGLIPENFVEICQRRTTAKVRHNFAAEEDNELSVNVRCARRPGPPRPRVDLTTLALSLLDPNPCRSPLPSLVPQVGDVVELLTRRSSDEGWLFVRHAGRSGLVPIAFLVLESAATAPPAALPTAAPPTAVPAAPLAAPPAAPAAASSAAPTDAPPAAVDQPSTPRAGLRKLWGGGAKVGLPQPAPGAADAAAPAVPAAPAAPAAPAPSTAPLGASGSSTNVPRCTSSFGRMLRKVSSFERKKEKPPSLRSGSQSARGRTSSGEVVGSAQCD